MTPRFICRLAALLAVGALAACSPSDQTPATPLPPGGDFILQGPQGAVDTKALRGKVLLVYFGYTHCPDVCPISLATMNEALNAMAPDTRSQIQPLMISVDPERDTPEALATYTSYFHPSLLGLTGSPVEIAAVAKAFGAGYVRQPVRPDGSYAVDHSGTTFVVDKRGKLVAMVPPGVPASEFAALVQRQL